MNKRFGSLALAVGMSFLLAFPTFAEESSTGTIYGNANTEASLSQDKTSGFHNRSWRCQDYYD